MDKYRGLDNIVIICVHHTKKVPDYAITPIDSILGSQGIAATVETILVMQEMSNTKDANLFVTGKDVEPAELVLQWCYPGYSDPELATLASLGSTQVEVLDFIRSNPRCTQSAIVNKTNKAKGQVSEIVGKLVKRDLIRKTDQGTFICTV